MQQPLLVVLVVDLWVLQLALKTQGLVVLVVQQQLLLVLPAVAVVTVVVAVDHLHLPELVIPVLAVVACKVVPVAVLVGRVQSPHVQFVRVEPVVACQEQLAVVVQQVQLLVKLVEQALRVQAAVATVAVAARILT